MKKLIYGFIVLLTACFTSCDDELNGRILPEDQQVINTERSAFYAMTGILQLMQEAGDEYVLLNELRGDLMTSTENTPQYLRDILEFNVDSSNIGLHPRHFYAIINNCNLLINKIDTSLVINGSKLLMKEMKSAKTFRAWAYMQLMNQYGKVYYYSQPIIDENQQENYKVVSEISELADSLVQDLIPFCPADGSLEEFPEYKTIGSFNSQNLFIPVRFMLGEIYLWNNQYAQAANMYYQMILTNKLLILNNKNSWNSTQTSFTTNWSKLFSDLTIQEQLSYIAFTNEYNGNSTLSTLTSESTFALAPSETALSNWESQVYSITNVTTLPGDLRGQGGSYNTFVKLNELNDKVRFSKITKYAGMNNYVTLCRTTLIYLRYAEAINRLGKPNLAFSVLKFGLNKLNLETYANKEIKSGERFIDFGQGPVNDDMFASNIGTRERGCGAVTLNNSFKIPADINDSVLWVEDQIINELALETAFEGNRFGDLMRISKRRADPAYLANKVAARFKDAQKALIIQKLNIQSNWFLPERK